MSTQMQDQQAPATVLPVTFQGTGLIRLVRVAVKPVLVGLERTLTEGLDYQFRPDGEGQRTGKLIVDDALLERDRDFFERNDPKFDGNPRTFEWLRNHGLFGQRFFEVPATPPDPAETHAMIATAAARGDESALASMYEHEERTFDRDEILSPIKQALAALEERKAIDVQGEGPPAALTGTAAEFKPPEPE